MMDNEDRTRLERLVAIDERISSNKFPTMRVLCQSFNVRPRTIYADIRLLRERFGLDIRFDRFRNGYYNANPGKRIPIGDLAEDDYVLAITGCFMLGAAFGSQMQNALRNVVNQMGKRLPFEMMCSEGDFERIFIRTGLSSVNLSEIDPEVLSHICRALLQNRVVEVEFKDGNKHVCTPFSFVEKEDGWHLIALDAESAQIGDHELLNISRCEVLEQQSKVERGPLLETFLAAQS